MKIEQKEEEVVVVVVVVAVAAVEEMKMEHCLQLNSLAESLEGLKQRDAVEDIETKIDDAEETIEKKQKIDSET